MKNFPATKAKQVLAALLKKNWVIKNEKGSHKVLYKQGYKLYSFCYHDSVEIPPDALKKISKVTGLQPEDL